MFPKVCIFCGNPPSDKNKEHVIPQWLISATGNPTRKVYLGRDWSSPDLKERVYSLSAFTFPACTACNSEFSALETSAKSIVENLLALQPVSAGDFDILLDWFDKVRVGLWVGLLYLNKNYRDVEPQFYIKSRIATRDRFLMIYQDQGELDGISIFGVESPIFQVMPSCFGLTVNNLHFFNASAQDLLAPFLGFPHLTNRKLSKDREGFSADVIPGSKTVLANLLPYSVPAGGTAILQGIVPPELKGSAEFEDPFFIENCRGHASGRGVIFIQQMGPAAPYPEAPSTEWIPPETFSKFECMTDQVFLTDVYLTRLYEDRPDMGDLTQEQRDFVGASTSGILRLHQVMVDHVRRQIQNSDSVGRFLPNNLQ
jgi:hypothetical protein